MNEPVVQTEVEHLVDAAAFAALHQRSPRLAQSISDLLSWGITPERMEVLAREHLGDHPDAEALARDIRHAACHLERIG